MKKKNHTTEEITVFEWREAVRERPAMYVGSTYIQGLINLLKSITIYPLSGLDSDRVSFEITGKMSGKLKVLNIKNPIKDNINENLQLFGCDFPLLNALSEKYEFIVFDKDRNETLKQIYQQGILKSGNVGEKEVNANSLEINFKLDESIWETFKIEPELVSDIFKEIAFLHKNEIFEINYSVKNEPCKIIYSFENGLQNKIEIEKNKGLGSTIFDTWFEVQLENCFVEAAFGFREYSVDEPYLKSYANDHYTHEGGTHVEGLLKGLTYGVMKHFQKHELTQKYKISEKGMRENLVAAIQIRMENPMFSGCVRNKLASSQIIEPIANYVADLLFQKIENDPESTEKLVRKFQIY
jgi:DNA gyrase subunit B